MKNFNKEDWNDLHHLLILFGRYKCKAINPQCETCELRELCKYKKEKKNVSR